MRQFFPSIPIARIGILAAALAVAAPASAEPNGVSRVALAEEGALTRLVLETDRAVPAPHVFLLRQPNRFVVDLPGAAWRRAGAGEGAGVAQRHRYANRPEGAARLVLDLDGPVRVAGQRVEQDGRRLVFELERVDSAAGLLGGPPPASRPRRTIVIDPGHGGRDPGALGVNGVREKDVALAAGRRLRAALEARGYRVAMTRDGDTFIELAGRVRFARDRNADLFISLHADSSPGSEAHGAAVYMLSEHGIARSRSLMDAQNWDLDLGAGSRSSEVRDILVDLTQRETTNRSAEFAQTVIGRLDAASVPIMHRNPRNAGFFVLLAPDVPAILVEMGFLSHSADEARLTDGGAQARMIAALADAVDAYFAPGVFAQARQ